MTTTRATYRFDVYVKDREHPVIVKAATYVGQPFAGGRFTGADGLLVAHFPASQLVGVVRHATPEPEEGA